MKLKSLFFLLVCSSLQGQEEKQFMSLREVYANNSQDAASVLLLDLSNQRRVIDIFGYDSRPKPKIKERKVAQNINFQAIVNQLPVTMVKMRTKQFVAAGQNFGVGDEIALEENGKQYAFVVEDVDLVKVALRSKATGGVFDRFLDSRPQSIKPNKRFRPNGIIPLKKSNKSPIRLK